MKAKKKHCMNFFVRNYKEKSGHVIVDLPMSNFKNGPTEQRENRLLATFFLFSHVGVINIWIIYI